MESTLVCGNQGSGEVRAQLDALSQVLPVVRVEELLRHHRRADLERFHHEHSALLAQSALLMVVPADCGDMEVEDETYCFLGLAKHVYPLDARHYVFLSHADQRAMRHRPERELAEFMRRHSGCLFKILAPPKPVEKRKREEEETTLVVLREAHTEARIALALERRKRDELSERYERELVHLKTQHATEKRLLESELTVEIQQRLLQQLSLQQGTLVPLQQRPAVRNRTLSRDAWIQSNLYGQDLSRLAQQPPPAQSRWFNLFTNPELTADVLMRAVQVVRVGAGLRQRWRLLVPLTYRYPLRRIIQCLAQALGQAQATHIKALLAACPADYTVVLYGAGLTDVKHRVNASTLALHLHLVLAARTINRANDEAGHNWRVKLCDAELPTHCVPSLDLLMEHYPASVYSGPGTYLTHDMAMPVRYHVVNQPQALATTATTKTKKNKSRKTAEGQTPSKGLGTGHGKRCPYCGQAAHTLIQGTNYCISHHPTRCPAIALLSQNEATLLATLRQRCQVGGGADGRAPGKLARHDFLVGKRSKKLSGGGGAGDRVFAFDSETLLRAASGEELERGEHDNGVRYNRQRLGEMRQRVMDTLQTQLDGPLFGPVDPQVAHLTRELADAADERVALRDQLYDEHDRLYRQAHTNPETRKPEHTFDDAGLFFALDPAMVPRSAALDFYGAFYIEECYRQQLFLAPPPSFGFDPVPMLTQFGEQ